MPKFIKLSPLRQAAALFVLAALLIWEIGYTILPDDITPCMFSKIYLVLAAGHTGDGPACGVAVETTAPPAPVTPQPPPLPTTVFQAAEQAVICPPDCANRPAVDLRRQNLVGAEFDAVDLAGADLRGLDLRDASFAGAHLAGVDLSGADLRSATFVKANLTGADLRQARLDGIILYQANLTGANLSGQDLAAVNRRLAHNLEELRLDQADLSHTRLTKLKLRGSSLVGANLRGADLRQTDLSEVDLTGAD